MLDAHDRHRRRVVYEIFTRPAPSHIPLGQTDGQRVLAALEETVAATAARALATQLDEIGSAAFRADLVTMRRSPVHARLFRS